MATTRNSATPPNEVICFERDHSYYKKGYEYIIIIVYFINEHLPYALQFDLTATRNSHVIQRIIDAGNGLGASAIEHKFHDLNEKLKKRTKKQTREGCSCFCIGFHLFIIVCVIGIIATSILERDYQFECQSGRICEILKDKGASKGVMAVMGPLRISCIVVMIIVIVGGQIYAYTRSSGISEAYDHEYDTEYDSIIQAEFEDWKNLGVIYSCKLGSAKSEDGKRDIRSLTLTLHTDPLTTSTAT